jgi:hypothetical protein
MLRIQKSANRRVVVTLSGRIEAQVFEELGQLLALETAGQQVVLALGGVTLVNQDAVEFLAGCEADSIQLKNCPAYIRVWIERVKGRTRRRRTMNGFEFSGRHTDVWRLSEKRKSDFRVQRLILPHRIRGS